MKLPPFKSLLSPVRELIRKSDAGERRYLEALARARQEQGRVGRRLQSLGGALRTPALSITAVDGEIGTTSARLVWHMPAENEQGFEVALIAPEARTLASARPHITLSGLTPATLYKGVVRPVGVPHAEAAFAFWTRPAGVTGYLSTLSATPGERVDLFVSSEHPDCNVTMRPLEKTDHPVQSWQLAARYQFAPYQAASQGCRWQRTLEIEVPETASGIYMMDIECPADGSHFFAPLIVRPHAAPELAVVCSTDTWNAYNNWGGQSFYDNFIDAPEPLWVTHARPNHLVHPWGQGTFHLLEAEMHVHKHLRRHGFAFGVYSDEDLAAGRLAGCRTVVIAGHNEYWCDEKLAAWDRLQAAGVNVVSLSGNNIFRRLLRASGRAVRYAFYEAADVCPRLGTIYTAAGRETGAPYEVLEPAHPLFAGTGVKRGDTFGVHRTGELSASGVETDKVMPESPAGVTVLARGQNPGQGGADFVWFRHAGGGWVLNAGSITAGLHMGDPVLDRLVVNALAHLGHTPGVSV